MGWLWNFLVGSISLALVLLSCCPARAELPFNSSVGANGTFPLTFQLLDLFSTPESDYDVPVTLDMAGLIAAYSSVGLIESTCNDKLLFVAFDPAVDPTPYAYWFETPCGISDARVWVRLRSIPASAEPFRFNLSLADAGGGDGVSWTGSFIAPTAGACPADWEHYDGINGSVPIGVAVGQPTEPGGSAHQHSQSSAISSDSYVLPVSVRMEGGGTGETVADNHEHTIRVATIANGNEWLPQVKMAFCVSSTIGIMSNVASLIFLSEFLPPSYVLVPQLISRFPVGGPGPLATSGDTSGHKHSFSLVSPVCSANCLPPQLYDDDTAWYPDARTTTTYHVHDMSWSSIGYQNEPKESTYPPFFRTGFVMANLGAGVVPAHGVVVMSLNVSSVPLGYMELPSFVGRVPLGGPPVTWTTGGQAQSHTHSVTIDWGNDTTSQGLEMHETGGGSLRPCSPDHDHGITSSGVTGTGVGNVLSHGVVYLKRKPFVPYVWGHIGDHVVVGGPSNETTNSTTNTTVIPGGTNSTNTTDTNMTTTGEGPNGTAIGPPGEDDEGGSGWVVAVAVLLGLGIPIVVVAVIVIVVVVVVVVRKKKREKKGEGDVPAEIAAPSSESKEPDLPIPVIEKDPGEMSKKLSKKEMKQQQRKSKAKFKTKKRKNKKGRKTLTLVGDGGEDELDRILEEDERQSVAKLDVDQSLFEIDYDELKVERSIGVGGSSATVFRATWNGIKVAFKAFKLHDFLSQERFSEFEREVKILASVHHPSILRFFGACLHPPRVGIIMEFCENGDVRHYLSDHPETSIDNIKLPSFAIKCIPSAMSFLHGKGIIHRDMKSDNVLLDGDLHAKVMDFGLSRKVSASQLKTARIGTAHYMAPEILLSEQYSDKVDVFSFGIMMFEIVANDFLPYGESLMHVEMKVANDASFRPKFKDEVAAGKYPDFAVILMRKCWQHSPENRPALRVVYEVLTTKDARKLQQ